MNINIKTCQYIQNCLKNDLVKFTNNFSSIAVLFINQFTCSTWVVLVVLLFPSSCLQLVFWVQQFGKGLINERTKFPENNQYP